MKKFTILLAVVLCTVTLYAQKPEITSIAIAGKGVRGFIDFNKTEMFTQKAEGEFFWIGYLNHSNPDAPSGSQGFKCKVNTTGQGNEWFEGIWSLRASVKDDEEVYDGSTHNVDYSEQTAATDFKWRVKQGEDGYYKITYYTSDVYNVTMKVEKVDDFADLISLSVMGAELKPAFDPAVTEYTCELIKGTKSVKPTVEAFSATSVSGDDEVDVSNGSGVSNIVVTSPDGSTTKTYTIEYTVSTEGEEDLSYLIINNDFNYVAEGVAYGDTGNYPHFSNGRSSFISDAWRPLEAGQTKPGENLDFYGWSLSDWDFFFVDENDAYIHTEGAAPNQSIGINGGTPSTNGSAAWINGHYKCIMPDDFEFYQIIDKDNLSEGTYRLSCLMGVQSVTSQRLFANNYVQYYGNEEEYGANKSAGETATFAGHPISSSGDTHYEMNVYFTLQQGDSLKIGIRSGNMNAEGNNGPNNSGNLRGWFKMDFFRLVKVDPADLANADLANITLSAGTLEFSPETTTYHVVLPAGTTTVTPTATPAMPGARVTGTEPVDVSEGEGQSVIVVTAPDGETTKEYTINYTVDVESNIGEIFVEALYSVNDSKLTVYNADSYVVYSINGVKVAEVNSNVAGTSVELPQGIYVVKAKNAKPFKVLVK